jgi:hypothetical protein
MCVQINATKAQGVKTDIVEMSRALTQLSSSNSLLGGDLDAVVGIMNELVVILDSDLSMNKSSTASLLCEVHTYVIHSFIHSFSFIT